MWNLADWAPICSNGSEVSKMYLWVGDFRDYMREIRIMQGSGIILDIMKGSVSWEKRD